jgi:PilZ domain-containing protein
MMYHKKRVRSPELRRSARRTVRYPARIDAGNGSPVLACTLADISQTGARLVVALGSDPPDEFSLLLGGASRRCRVVWRSEKQVGVRFLSTT